jgi:SAM-dependent methyltransferase
MRWKTRNQEEARLGYLVNRSAESNNFLWDLIDLSRINTILELGSNSGNRLIEVASRFPEKTFVGVDINISAVTLGNEWAITKGIENLTFIHADITSPQFYAYFLNRKFDCVVTWATLIYIHPVRIKKLVQFLLAITSKQIVLIEQNDSRLGVFPKYLGIPVPGEPTWVRNYEKIFSSVKSHKTFDVNLEPVSEEIWHPGGGLATVINVTIQEVSNA